MRFLPCLMFIILCLSENILAQNVGIGTQSPQQKLDVNGKIRIGNDNGSPAPGTIRYNDATNDFEGFNGSEWKSLTASYSDVPLINNAALVEEQGYSIAIHGDFAVVGAPQSDAGVGLAGIGVVFVFKRVNKQWQYQQQFFYGGDRRFGTSVAINDNFIFIGAPLTGGLIQDGQVSVLKKVNGVFQYFTQFRATTRVDLEKYGTSLSLHGNYLAIGCRGHFNAGIPGNAGSVYIYKISNDVFTQLQRIDNPTGIPNQEFGVSIAVDSSVLVVGASKAPSSGDAGRGMVYVYKNSGSDNYVFANTIEYALYGAAEDNFGKSIAMYEHRIVIGCPGLDIPPLNNIGAIFTCAKDGNGDFLSSNLEIRTHPFDTPETFFGKSVAMHNNILLAGSNKAVYEYLTFDGLWQYHKIVSNSLPGISNIDAYALAIYELNYGIGDPVFNGSRGRIALGDCRY
ncbi:MAG: hypothetical protein H7Y31_10020 [Chitinophagaceae bacterium]|nr:hypothetical protein [Chitinophagaceae bacterium]